ncbi:PAS domain S-box protein [Actinocrispum sp. NPDC049592]|uniref:PAS domain-containing sensor histidine kinase n=1 Tax=Actinocrispum sp. NPDC049592 TaxID=3154835 RepID=UPI0034258437
MTTPAPAPDAFRLMVQSVVDYAIFMLDPTGSILSWNAGAERIKGYRAEEIIGRNFAVLYPPEDLAAGKPERELEIAVAQGRLEDEGWRLRKDGTRFWANVVITALYDDSGQLCGFGKVTRDMTERRAAEEALRASEERFRLVVQDVVDYAIFMLDPDGSVLSWNAGAERIKGYRADEILGRNFAVFYPPEDLAAGKPERELEIAVAQGRLEDEGWRLRKDGTRFWANVVITALYDDSGELRGFGKVTRDMTERRTAERALSDRGRLLAHMVEAQEAERRRIAWDVHDDSIQAMVSVAMRLQLLAGKLPAHHAAELTALDDAVRDTITRLRDLVRHLQPPPLDQGLADTLKDLLAATGIPHTLTYTLPADPPQETAITLFRICQEALTNTRKHAQASTVDMTVKTADNGILVQVHDNGIGPGPAATRTPTSDHFGLIEMRERAEIAEGWLTIKAPETGGTTIEFWLPTPTP